MKFRLGPIASDLFLVVYIMATLFIRIYIEPQLHGNLLISLGLGVFALLFAWALIKIKFLNPSILGLGEKTAQPQAETEQAA